jgi:hypothetical protein
MATYQYWSSGGASGSAGYLSCDNVTITDTITLGSEFAILMRAKTYLAGNGVDSYLVQSASFQQDAHWSPITVNNATTFYVPAYGRWSDYSSLVGFTIPGTVDAVMECKLKVPILTPIIGGGGTGTIDTTPTGTGEPGVIGAIDNGEVSGEYLTLNFEGTDGATTYLEESHGYSPLTNDLCEIDTAQHHTGLSSLLLKQNGYIDYYGFHVSSIGFIWSFDIMFSAALTGGDLIYIEGKSSEGHSISITFNSTGLMMFYGPFYSHGIYALNVWHNFEIRIPNRTTVIVLVNGIERCRDVATHNMMDGFNYVAFGNYTHHSNADVWLDNISVRSYVPALDITSVTSTETITVTDNSLIQAGDTITITGTSA